MNIALIILASLGLVYYIYRVVRKRKKFQSEKKEIDDVLIQLVSNNSTINYSPDDQVRYMGSFATDDASYDGFKNVLPMDYKNLVKYFNGYKYDTTGDNLLMYTVIKTNNQSFYVVAVLDSMDMNIPFNIHEILGPFEY